MDTLDYKEIEFRGGLELHQQINTRKLFCECQALVREDPPPETTKRKLHAVASELGEYDPAAIHEAYRDRTFYYQSYHDSVCLVELDEEPPHPVNREALKVVLEVALVLDARMVDEIQVMRKTVIDGSNTAGFQRTMLVATDGTVETDEGSVNLQYFCLEEDAARIIETNEREVKYRLDRLGIPLLEIVMGPNCVSPRQAGGVADKLGHIIRSLNVKRGIGSIRQDVNVSTKYGTRIEIKGVQRHRMIPTIMAWEAQRQVSLYNIAQELRSLPERYSRGMLEDMTADVTDIFRMSASPQLRQVIDNGGTVTAICLPGFAGFLGREICPGKRLGTEMRDQVLTLGIKGLMHGDEQLDQYGLTGEEVSSLRAELNAGDGDGFLFFASKPEVVDKALGKLYRRLSACFDGVPKESRRALHDGNTQFMRPLPGEARMYPETDIPPVIVTEEMCDELRRNLPEILENKLELISKESGIPVHDLWKIEEYMEAFLYGVEELQLKPAQVYTVIGSNVVDTRRKTGKDFDNETLRRLLEELHKGSIIMEAVPGLLMDIASCKGLDEALSALQRRELNLADEIRRVVDENRDLLSNPKRHAILMGELMKSLRGKADGQTLSAELKKYLENIPS